MSKPVVAIVGRPNVGKSTFFNYIVGQKISIVEDKPGVTRDRIYADTEWRGRKFTLVDTAGIEPKQDDQIINSMREQVQIAIDLADVIVFLTDIKQGVTEADKDIALILKKSKKEVILVCNKADKFGKENTEIYEFYNLGLGTPHAVSSANATRNRRHTRRNIQSFSRKKRKRGRRRKDKSCVNTENQMCGKSSLVNKILRRK